MRENGLKPKQITFSDGALRQIISEYTSEAGVRNLEREIGNVCRKVARRIAEGRRKPAHVSRQTLPKYLGAPKFIPEMDQEESQVGLATGLAWTQVGGEVLYVEASLMRGKGDLIVTGQLGEVMQESARAAVTYARAYVRDAWARNETSTPRTCTSTCRPAPSPRTARPPGSPWRRRSSRP